MLQVSNSEDDFLSAKGNCGYNLWSFKIEGIIYAQGIVCWRQRRCGSIRVNTQDRFGYKITL